MAGLLASNASEGFDWGKFIMPDFDFMGSDSYAAQAVREHLGQSFLVFMKHKGRNPMNVAKYCIATQYKRSQNRETNEINLSSILPDEDGNPAEDRLMVLKEGTTEPAYTISNDFIENEYYAECLEKFPNTRDYIAREYTIDLCDLMLSCNAGNTQAMESLRNLCAQVEGLQTTVMDIMRHYNWAADIERMSATMPILLDNDYIPTALSAAFDEIRDMRSYVFAEDGVDIVLLAVKALEGEKAAQKKLQAVCDDYEGLQAIFQTVFESEIGYDVLQNMQDEEICLD